MPVQEGAVAWVALRAAERVGDVIGRRLLARFGSPDAVLAASAEELGAAGASPAVARALAAARAATHAALAEVERVQALGARIVPYVAPEYPAPLREIHDAPLYLVARGAPLLGGPAVAVVGARRASPYGREVAARLAEELALAGVTVVSGLARGADGAAHDGALRGRGHTIAVLGSGIDVVYPAEHRDLAERIVHAGTLLSERSVGAAPLAAHFPARNRIIAGMTHGTLVVEAAEGSGSLITARYALDYGREVFAVPGRIDSPLSVGTHRLLQQGAKLTMSVDDVLSEIAPALRARAAAPQARRAHDDDGGAAADADVRTRLVALLAGGPLAIDTLIRETGLPPAEVLTHVLDLELSGVVAPLPGQHYQLARRQGL